MRRIALFARPPLAGSTKTRLSPALPPALAATLAAALLEDSARSVARAEAEERAVWWAEAPGVCMAEGLSSELQRGGDLGERLAHAFHSLLRSPEDRALVVGSDTPGLASAHLENALAQLETHDMVVGPAADGGYWCIGLKRVVPSLFRDIAWSTDRVMPSTLERAREAGLSVALAERLADLDTPADLARLLGERARGGNACGPALLGALRGMGLVPGWLAPA